MIQRRYRDIPIGMDETMFGFTEASMPRLCSIIERTRKCQTEVFGELAFPRRGLKSSARAEDRRLVSARQVRLRREEAVSVHNNVLQWKMER